MSIYNLREIKRVAANSVEDEILQLVDCDEQVLAEGCHCSGCSRGSWARKVMRLVVRSVKLELLDGRRPRRHR